MNIKSNSIASVINYFHQGLKDAYPKEEIQSFIFLLCEHYLGYSRSDVLLNKEKNISESELLKFHFAMKDLQRHKPIQYIMGETIFYGAKIRVNEHVLIPRPETEEMVHWIVSEHAKSEKLCLLDVGTGSGCIAIALKKHFTDATIDAIDVSPEALAVAEGNACLNGVTINFKQCDVLDDSCSFSLAKYNVIVSNPPYVLMSEKGAMKNNVTHYEPHTALFVSDSNPLIFYKAIHQLALKHLFSGGKLYVEINEDYGKQLQELFQNNGFAEVTLKKDLNAKDRMLSCVKT